MMGLEEIKKINQDPEAYYKSQESDGQSKGKIDLSLPNCHHADKIAAYWSSLNKKDK